MLYTRKYDLERSVKGRRHTQSICSGRCKWGDLRVRLGERAELDLKVSVTTF